jgi:oxygen-independent coproporphyrinogen-3 oxidase
MNDADVEALAPDALLRERIMLGLRIAEGVDLGKAATDLGVDPWTQERTREIARLVDKKRLEREGDVLRIPREAWLFTDDTASRLF